MTDARRSAQNLTRLLKSFAKQPAVTAIEPADEIAVLVQSFLMWDSTTAKANAAYKRLLEHVVDFNDLRVSMPQETVERIGPRYSRALERCQRLRAVLRHIFKREHDMTLRRLHALGKREIKKYLRSLDGIAPYVADRVTLLCFETHCIPVDERLRRALQNAGVCDETVELTELASWLARRVKATDATTAHRALQGLADRTGANSGASATRSTAKGAGKLADARP